jgi:hypothetical protein
MYIFLFIIFLIMILTSWHSSKKRNSFLDKITDKVSLMSSIFIPIGMFVTYQLFEIQYQTTKREATYEIIDRAWLAVAKTLEKYYDKCPNFIESLYFDWQKNNRQDIKITKEENWKHIEYVCVTIFQSWEDYITSTNVDETDSEAWVIVFIQWTYSDQLREKWKFMKYQNAQTTQKFGDFLFHMSKTHDEPKNPDELMKLTRLIINHKTFKKIMNDRHDSTDKNAYN